jgi:adenosylcobinamide kinase/adenosylcobinamide-phosphate guanylyltransferase
MAKRIAAHRRERPAHWKVREEPVELGRVLREERALLPQSPEGTAAAAHPGLVLIDCLTLWISNCLWSSGSADVDLAGWHRERDDFLDALSACLCEVIIVTNEVGTGIVPDNNAARVFRDEQGWLNQAVAAVCDEVYFVTAGLAMALKTVAPPGHITTQPR